MKRTSAGTLLGLFLAGGVVAYLIELIFQSRGSFIFIPPVSLSFTLFLISVATILMAIPIRRRHNGKTREPINPFYAARVVALAKASALSGAVFLGMGIGILLYLLGRPIAPTGNMLGAVIAEIVASILLITSGLIAEWWCALPPEDKEENTEVVGEPTA